MKAPAGWGLLPEYQERVDGAVSALRALGFHGAPLAVQLGSGLGNVVDQLEIQAEVPFGDIPGFHAPTVKAHPGKLLQARHAGQDILVSVGRLHAYEGLDMGETVLPIATLMALGAHTILLTNAAGGLHRDMIAGDLLALTGLVDLHWIDALRKLIVPTAELDPLTLRGQVHNRPFDRTLANQLVRAGESAKVSVRTGTYTSVWGPNYETAAEIGMLRRMGGDAVGMSTGPEAAFAHALGARVAGLSCITNVAVEDGGQVVTHDEVVEVGAARRDDMARVLLAALPGLASA